MLPNEFINQMKELLGEDEYRLFEEALQQPAPISIRVRSMDCIPFPELIDEPVPWCDHGFYLKSRPDFTMDPLLHAGAYYVQEASSMYLAQFLKDEGAPFLSQSKPLTALDLCAAPGGKATLLRSWLPDDALLIANEYVHKRAWILHENMSKWMRTSSAPTVVTNNAPIDFQRLGSHVFDIILADMPCSGEGMFRKDPKTIDEWSPDNVVMCQQRQRTIVDDIWDSLRPGGLFIYSTCTYNKLENEDNIQWIAKNYDASIIHTRRFMPHRTKGEGLFFAALKKNGDYHSHPKSHSSILASHCLNELPLEVIKADIPTCDVDNATAIRFLQGECLRLPDNVAKGQVAITYNSLPLGLVKNIGSRANNLYQKQWRIRKKS